MWKFKGPGIFKTILKKKSKVGYITWLQDEVSVELV